VILKKCIVKSPSETRASEICVDTQNVYSVEQFQKRRRNLSAQHREIQVISSTVPCPTVLKTIGRGRGPSILRRDFYVDGALTGVDTKEEVVSIRKELTKLLRSAGLNIREWASNDQDILRGLSEIDKNQRLQLGESPTLKTLGVFWDSHDDAILYSVETKTNMSHITKRSISSVIARIKSTFRMEAILFTINIIE
jgi:hypothetical protein